MKTHVYNHVRLQKSVRVQSQRGYPHELTQSPYQLHNSRRASRNGHNCSHCPRPPSICMQVDTGSGKLAYTLLYLDQRSYAYVRGSGHVRVLVILEPGDGGRTCTASVRVAPVAASNGPLSVHHVSIGDHGSPWTRTCTQERRAYHRNLPHPPTPRAHPSGHPHAIHGSHLDQNESK